MSSVRKMSLVLWLALAPAGWAMADTVWVGAGANPIPHPDVKISAITDDNLVYTSVSGAEEHKPLSQVQQIAVDGETAFNAGEQAFRDSKWADAVDSYQQAIGSTSKDWIKLRSSMRLVDAAAKINRYDAAVTAYVSLVQLAPALTEKAKPSAPDANSQYLDAAQNTISKSLDSSTLTDSQKSSLLNILLDIYQAKKDTTNATNVLEQLEKLGSLSPAATASLKLDAARVAMDKKDYQTALDDIQQHRAVFIEPKQQVTALWILAQAQDGLNSDKEDPNSLKDLALAYMRVATFGKDLQDQPHVPDSLLRVAQIEEKLKEPKVASQLYAEIVKNYPDQPAAATAKDSMGRINKGT